MIATDVHTRRRRRRRRRRQCYLSPSCSTA